MRCFTDWWRCCSGRSCNDCERRAAADPELRYSALHPVTVMSVAWMTGIEKHPFGGIGIRGGLKLSFLPDWGVYDRGDKSGANAAILDLTFLCPCPWHLPTLALLARQRLAPHPQTLLLICWWQQAKHGWRDIWPLIPMLGMAGVMGQVTSYVEHHSGGATGTRIQPRFCRSGFWFQGTRWFIWATPGTASADVFYPRWHI